MNESVQFVSLEQLLPLRAKILRPQMSLDKSLYPEDHEPKTFHLGVLNPNKVLLSVGTFINQVPTDENLKKELLNSITIPNAMPKELTNSLSNAYRLRGMATEETMQGKGLGSKIILEAEKILKQRKCNLLWFNARTKAMNFYIKLGYEFKPEIFEFPGIGPHCLMYKYFKEH
jgi:predicted GNAT family N-acyltransferase